MTVAWIDYLTDVLFEAPQCPDSIAIHTVRSSVIELCQQENLWQVQLPRVTLVAANPLITLVPPVDSEISTVLDVRFYRPGDTTGKPVLGPYDNLTLNTQRPNWQDEVSQGTENSMSACTYPSPNVLRVIPVPIVSTGEISVMVALRPTRGSAGGPDFIYQDHLMTIVTGALGRLLMMVNKPWANPNLASVKLELWHQMKTRAGIRSIQGTGMTSMTVYPRTLA